MRKNTYRLSGKPASFYQDLYDNSPMTTVELGGGGQAAYVYLSSIDVGIQYPVEFGELRADLLPIGKEVMSQVVAMDDAARAAKSDDAHDDDEVLSTIIVREFFVEFEYTANAWNSNWFEFFTRDDNGAWRHRGCRLPWMLDWRTNHSPNLIPSAIVAVDAAYGKVSSSAAGVLFSDWSALEAMASFSKRIDGMPIAYQPGEFYKRELPVLMSLLNETPNPISAIVVDGYVWLSGDGKPGLGARLFETLARRVPVIGVAKTKFADDTWSLPVRRGVSEAPLYVTSAGIDRTDAAQRILRMSGGARIPALLKQADGLAREALL